jgi:hypothetical protein
LRRPPFEAREVARARCRAVDDQARRQRDRTENVANSNYGILNAVFSAVGNRQSAAAAGLRYPFQVSTR